MIFDDGSSVTALSEIISASDQETGTRQRKRRDNAFGRTDLLETYRKAKDYIIEHRLLKMSQYVELDGVRQLTICNLWRIERLLDGAIRTLEYDLHTGLWHEVTELAFWPDIPFYPIHRTKSLNWWINIIRHAIWKALIAAGYKNLPRYRTEIKGWNYVENMPMGGKKEMSKYQMAYCLIHHYLGKNDKRGFLDPASMKAGARSLRAIFTTQFLDREVVSAALAINYKFLSFETYLYYARFRAGLLKVASEHRNLLPLLPGINPEKWGRDDLFSRKTWVRNGRRSTAIDRRPLRYDKEDPSTMAFAFQAFQTITRYPFYHSFNEAAAWNWLSKASSVIVREWVQQTVYSDKELNIIVTNLALANINVKAPVYAYVIILRGASRLIKYGVSPVIQRLLRLFLAHSATMWKEKGYTEVRVWLRDSNQASIRMMLDYLEAEGFRQNLPDRQSTWASLLRRSEDWHQRVAAQKVLDTKLYKWPSLVPETVIDDIIFTPLSNSRALAKEGYEMHHCVGQYAIHCRKRTYRVYAVTEPDGNRSTLGIDIHGRSATWDQHWGKCNSPVSPAAHQAGIRLVELYQQALSQKGKTVRKVS